MIKEENKPQFLGRFPSVVALAAGSTYATFLIQKSQNNDSLTIQIKLNEQGGLT